MGVGGSVSTPKSKIPYKCVVIGETGSGKTSFLNLIGNLAKVLQLAETDDLTLNILKHFHKEAMTENRAKQGKSQTNKAHGYKVPGLGFDLTIIDTPGFGDTEGLTEDQKHMVSIQQAIEKEDAINCIVLVINGRVPRVTPQLRYVLANICSILPKKIMDQIVVVFTQVADPDDDLLFDPNNLTEFLGQPLPEDQQLCLDNPYAKVANLIEKGSKNTAAKLRTIKAGFSMTSEMLADLFNKISTFPSVGTHMFKQLYETRQEIDKKAKLLNAKFEILSNDKKRASDLKCKLLDDATKKDALKDFETKSTVTYWDFEDTPDRHHMVCSQCNSNCHIDCHILKGLDKTACFKDCQCFQWKATKEIIIQTEAHRQSLLNNVEDTTFNMVSAEIGTQCGTKYGLRSTTNFSINGTLVRGDPEKQWTCSLFSTHAVCFGMTLEDVRSNSLPFSVTFVDCSNVEKGLGMVCNSCGHSMSSHSHQTCLHIKKSKTETHVDQTKKDKFNLISTTIGKQTAALEQVNAKLAALLIEENNLKKELKENLQRFSKISASSSYVALLNEQTTFLHTLMKNANSSHNEDSIKALTEQLQMIEALRTACSS